MPTRSKVQEVLLLGVPELDGKLKELGYRIGNRVARKALSAGARVGLRLVKQQVKPTRLRKAFGFLVKQNKKHVTQAKVGAGVGKAYKATINRPAGRKGVGISGRNVHWWVMGTGDRYRKSWAGRALRGGSYTGRMPDNPVVKRALTSGQTQVAAAIEDRARTEIAKEVAKLAARK